MQWIMIYSTNEYEKNIKLMLKFNFACLYLVSFLCKFPWRHSENDCFWIEIEFTIKSSENWFENKTFYSNGIGA